MESSPYRSNRAMPAVSKTRFSLIVWPVNPRKQNLWAMLRTLPCIWGLGNECIGRILENKFIFQYEHDMVSILQRGPWSFNNWMCVTQRWNPVATADDRLHIPIWVQIRGIPLQYLTSRIVHFIGHSLDNFMETDFDRSVFVEYVRVRLLWPIDSPLKFQRVFRFGDDDTTVLQFKYEKLGNFCISCGLLSHKSSQCPANVMHEKE